MEPTTNIGKQDLELKTNTSSVFENILVNSHQSHGQLVTKCPDRLLAPNSFNCPETSHRFTTRLPSSIPNWLWALLAYSMGISPDKDLTKAQRQVSKGIRFLTIFTAAGFSIFGLLINIYQTVNELNKVTVLICIFKSTVGLFWILLGLYSHSLAVRSFSSKGLLNFIRLHSKTFLKIGTSLWIALLLVSVLAVNVYRSMYLLHPNEDDRKANGTKEIIDATCASIGLEETVCQIYFGFKVALASLNLLWISVVAAICLSVCRTHAICIRRFMKELTYDAKIYEEFVKLDMLRRQTSNGDSQEQINALGDNDIDESWQEKYANRESYMERRWQSIKDLRESEELSRRNTLPNMNELGDTDTHLSRPETKDPLLESKPSQDTAGGVAIDMGQEPTEPTPKKMKDLLTAPPIMSNNDLYFTHFKIVKNLSMTSRLLQRWMSCSLVFVVMWCLLMVIFWTNHVATLMDIVQFLIPYIVVGLLISAYAEVNYEGTQLPKYVLPTIERTAVIFYIKERHLELKVYTFVLTHKILATLAAGIVGSFATRIILYNVF